MLLASPSCVWCPSCRLPCGLVEWRGGCVVMPCLRIGSGTLYCPVPLHIVPFPFTLSVPFVLFSFFFCLVVSCLLWVGKCGGVRVWCLLSHIVAVLWCVMPWSYCCVVCGEWWVVCVMNSGGGGAVCVCFIVSCVLFFFSVFSSSLCVCCHSIVGLGCVVVEWR